MSNEEALAQQQEIVAALTRLGNSLKEYSDQESAASLSHYRKMPEAVEQSYNLLHEGAQLIHGTSTKYTLLGKLDAKEQTKMAQELLRGCQLLGTGCLVLHDEQSGCARSTRKHCKQACRAIVHTVIQMLEVWIKHLAEGEGNNLGAQKAGAVWEMCNTILEKRLPKGNRNAMRRDLLTYMSECLETATEFQELIDEGPALEEGDGEEDDVGSEEAFDNFMGGDDSQYTLKELPVAMAALYLIKCSRGCLNLSGKFIEAVGTQLGEQNEGKVAADGDKEKLAIISKVHDLARDVGTGMTDLGASMYPPLQLPSLKSEIERQAGSLQLAFDYMADASLEMPDEVTELMSKLREHLPSRKETALEAIQKCSESN